MYEVRRWAGRFWLVGAVGGALGGMTFILVQMAVAAALGYSPASPLRAIGSIILGPPAMSAEYPLDGAVFAGLALHLALSIAYGMVFVWALWLAGQTGRLNSITIALGVIFALALWMINFLVIAPLLFDQMVGEPMFLLSFTVGHFFYGLVLGAYVMVASVWARPEPGTR